MWEKFKRFVLKQLVIIFIDNRDVIKEEFDKAEKKEAVKK